MLYDTGGGVAELAGGGVLGGAVDGPDYLLGAAVHQEEVAPRAGGSRAWFCGTASSEFRAEARSVLLLVFVFFVGWRQVAEREAGRVA